MEPVVGILVHWMTINKCYNATPKKVNTVKETLHIFLGKY